MGWNDCIRFNDSYIKGLIMFESHISGIPCQIKVTYYTPYVPANFDFPAEGGEFEFEVYDRKGYRAVWLENKITEEDEDRIFDEFIKWGDELREGQI